MNLQSFIIIAAFTSFLYLNTSEVRENAFSGVLIIWK
ncbi:hypothetical protein FOPG_20155 [Fusarium oxysporum f. sp. conglutinans race 2 54008]|uniref:Uncharacterized protein n=1 Tax=Fusarium oxysporum f. sp. conglutinans race 2 54008 TaxID=1089457 RepID=X0GUP0_FUSOX|nr:hypothetical protein FOPG_20155 [Fusarium oxysporum f. sp. conglutinans race 2 54008]